MRQINKILLIHPPMNKHKTQAKWVSPPLGLAYIAAVLEKKYEVRILDASIEGYDTEVQIDDERIRYGLPFDSIKKEIEGFSPDIVGVSCPFSTLSKNAHEILRVTKEADKSIVTIMGGAHPSGVPEEVMQDKNIDFIVIGEGERTIQKLIEKIEKGKGFSKLDGIGYKENGEIRIIPKTRYIDDIDELPFPARHLMPMEKYFKIKVSHVEPKKTPYTTVITSRGCPGRCVFCSIHTVWGRKFRGRSPANVLDEIEHLVSEYGVREIHFGDDNLTFDKKRAKKIFDGIVERRLDITWATPNGIALWRLDKELLVKMKKSGCHSLNLAIESGDEEVLRHIIKKPLRLEKVKELVGTINELGISTYGFFVIGMPGETKHQIKKTIDFAYSLDIDDAGFFMATPYPGTELYSICKERGYLLEDPIRFENLRVAKANIETPEISSGELEELYKEAGRKILFKKFKKHPKTLLRYIWDNLKVLSNPRELVLGCRRWMGFLRTHFRSSS